MDSNIVSIAQGLREIRRLAERQKKGPKVWTDGQKPEDIRHFSDLNIELSGHFETPKDSFKDFNRKTVFVPKSESLAEESGLRWTSPSLSEKRGVGVVGAQQRERTRRFVCVVKKEESKTATKRMKDKKNIVVMTTTTTTTPTTTCGQRVDDRREIREYMRRQRARRKAPEEEARVGPSVRRVKSYDVQSVRQFMAEKRRERAVSHRKEEEVVVKSVSAVEVEVEVEVEKGVECNEGVEDVVAEETTRADERRQVETSVRQMVEKAVSEVPDWETLWRRVYRTTFGDRSQTSDDNSWRQLSPKAMEVFPTSCRPKSTSEEVLSSDAMSASREMFRLTSDLEGVVDDDDTDDVSSLEEEVGGVSVGLSAVATPAPELVSDVNVSAVVSEYCLQWFEAHKEGQMVECADSGTAFREFLFDVCAEVIEDDFGHTRHPWPSSHTLLTQHVIRRVESVMAVEGPKADIRRDGLMAFCRRSKSRDLVDQVLYREICAEDTRWTSFETETVAIKDEITAQIVDQLVAEALKEYSLLQ